MKVLINRGKEYYSTRARTYTYTETLSKENIRDICSQEQKFSKSGIELSLVCFWKLEKFGMVFDRVHTRWSITYVIWIFLSLCWSVIRMEDFESLGWSVIGIIWCAHCSEILNLVGLHWRSGFDKRRFQCLKVFDEASQV